MTPKEAAQALDGSEYREEGSEELFKQMSIEGLVAVFGASDDLMEFRGAIEDEIGCYDGGDAFLTREGILENQCDCDECPYFKQIHSKATKLEAIWAPPDSRASWAYETEIPHERFRVLEDGEMYCWGIVFRLADVPASRRG